VYITRIESQKRHPERKNIFADGRFVLGISKETLLKAGLRVGDEITQAVIQRLQETEGLSAAKNAALRFIAYRPRTVREVRDKLREKEFSDEEISRVIEDLTRAKLLNDREFARMFVRDAVSSRPVGKLLLRRKMLLLGLERQLVDEVLAEELEDVDLEQSAREAAEKFVKRSRTVRGREETLKLRNRLAAFLGRRGFGWDIIQPVIQKVLKENEFEETE
jgi:regulatory protein